MDAFFAELSTADDVVRFEGEGGLDCLCIAKGSIEGWWSTPTPKVTVTSRGQGDGGHDIVEEDISYASRTVTLHWNANASDRQSLLALTNRVRRLAHRHVRMRVVDGGEDTCCEQGYISVTQAADYRAGSIADSTITIVFERPERLSSQPQKVQIWPQADSGNGGLRYGDKAAGLQYPIQYGVEVSDSRNACVLRNDGTSRAYPIFQVTGPFPNGVMIAFADGSSIAYSQPVGVTPLTFDSRSNSATIGGVDVSRGLTARGFPVIEPGGSLGVTLQSSGSGWVTCVTHDTYM